MVGLGVSTVGKEVCYASIKNVIIGTGVGGAQTADLFTVQGMVKILGIYGITHDVVDTTTCSTIYFGLDDGTTIFDLTAGSPGDFTGAVDYYSFFHEDLGGQVSLGYVCPSADTYATSNFLNCPYILVANTGATLLFGYTEDANTELQIDVIIEYIKITPDATITAV